MPEIADRLSDIRARIGAALARSPDPGREVTIVAVTKTRPAEVIDEVAAAGVLDIGESRVQEALAKAPLVRTRVRWHLVGHLQRNKARRAVELFSVIHSVDSLPLLDLLAASGRPLQAFLEINVLGDVRKHGARPEHARALRQAALGTGTIEVLGLMTVPPLEGDPRPAFRTLRELLGDLNRAGDGPPLRCLSMGMSGDFEAAVEEGATHVRIGTALVAARSHGGR
ncbi:MAG TPA: YggS family pyridoxal phosphate-dependent enzyme [Planctomycetota bacterium]|nr:YggS family pyridoxal phosphate-dependent enzyme [Planctomycetota bacterium]